MNDATGKLSLHCIAPCGGWAGQQPEPPLKIIAVVIRQPAGRWSTLAVAAVAMKGACSAQDSHRVW